jgi:hypothetical protein
MGIALKNAIAPKLAELVSKVLTVNACGAVASGG